MKRIALLALTAFVSLLAVANGSKALQVKELKLSNGLTVWLNEDHSQPKVFGALVVKAGAKDCPNTGIAHYLEHVLFKGTQKIGTVDYEAEKVWLDSISTKYNELSQTTDNQQRLSIQHDISRLSQRAADYAIPNEFDRLISRYGGSALNASTSYDVTEYHNTFAPQFLEQWCWLNSERMLNPVFRLFQGELETVYEEKNRSADDMFNGAVERVMEAAFKGHPYQYPIIGSTENLKNPRLSDMEDFFRRYYVAGNMGLMLSGDFSSEGIEPLLERTFGRLPKGEAPKTEPTALQPFDGTTVDLKLNIPLMKAVGLLFRGPLSTDADFRSLQLAMRLLSNDNQTGLLDSLRTAHKVMFALSENFALNEAGAVGLVVIPKIPFGSKKKAERLCWQQIERVKAGDFSEEKLTELKQVMMRDIDDELEAMASRAQLMGEVFSQGRSWSSYLRQVEAISTITKADVVAAARRYLLPDHYLRGVKRFGSYPKDKLTQPDYKPVVPKNAKEQSAYARELAQLPVSDKAPRLIDLDHDAEATTLADQATLYRVGNDVNDLFSLSLKWYRGERQEPRMILLDGYLDELGTDSLTKHQLGEAWQQLGTTLEVSVSTNYFMVTVKGFDKNLEPSLCLLRHWLTSLKPDAEAAKELASEYKMSYKQQDRTNSSVMQMVMSKIMRGDQSEYLRQPTPQEVKKLTGEQLLQLFADERQYHCDVLYCGTQSSQSVAGLCRKYLSPQVPRHAPLDTYIRYQQYSEPLVYVYDMPDARQTYVGTYGSVKPSLTDKEDALLTLWSQYMGGSMNSVLFQEIREFRSMAYSTGGYSFTPNRSRHNDYPSGYLFYLGTQADKTMQALAVLDSLMQQMPVNEQNVASARQEILNEINNGYPSFRQLPHFISSFRAAGYPADPKSSRARIVPTLHTDDMVAFYRQEIQQKPRVWFIVGNKKQLDMKALGKYGKVVELKRQDIMR
ncbi:MAG: insulinase family protein [Prevotella sp.]|nr:insulinase family protein [Prevotella sp.]